MINKNGHALVVGQPYYSRFDSDTYTIDSIFGKYADTENRRTKNKRWIPVDNLIPYVRLKPKSYLDKPSKDSK